MSKTKEIDFDFGLKNLTLHFLGRKKISAENLVQLRTISIFYAKDQVSWTMILITDLQYAPILCQKPKNLILVLKKKDDFWHRILNKFNLLLLRSPKSGQNKKGQEVAPFFGSFSSAASCKKIQKNRAARKFFGLSYSVTALDTLHRGWT